MRRVVEQGSDEMALAFRWTATLALAVASCVQQMSPGYLSGDEEQALTDRANLACFSARVGAREDVDLARSKDGWRWCGVVLLGDVPRLACSGERLVGERLSGSTRRGRVTCPRCLKAIGSGVLSYEDGRPGEAVQG